MLKRLRNKIKTVSLLSLSLTLLLILVILSVIDGGFAMGILAVALFIGSIFNHIKPKWIDGFCLKWNNLAPVTHYSLLFLDAASLLYIVVFFIKNYEIQIVPKNFNSRINDNL